eukprot:15485569-Alexandrium_andersonii.AAC.1
MAQPSSDLRHIWGKMARERSREEARARRLKYLMEITRKRAARSLKMRGTPPYLHLWQNMKNWPGGKRPGGPPRWRSAPPVPLFVDVKSPTKRSERVAYTYNDNTEQFER